MNRNIIGIIIVILLITTVIPVTSFSTYEYKNYNHSYLTIQKEPNFVPVPGCMKGDSLDILANYLTYDNSSITKTNQMSYNEDIISLIQQIDEKTYLGFLENLTAFGPRVTATPACNDAGEYIYNEFQEMGLETIFQEWESGSLYGTNVEAILHGLDESSDEIYIICAHYDSVPGSPGADDDGSGTAAVMTAAKVMSQLLFNHTIKFVTFSGEEQGLYGSYYYVQEAYNNGDNIIGALNADMIGFAIDENDASIIEVFEDEGSLWLAEFTENMSIEYYDYFELEVILSGYTWGSDHYRFWEAGYHAIFYFEHNFNDYYHTSGDTIENMDIDYATRVTQLIIATLAELSEITNANRPPAIPIIEGPTSGKTGTEYDFTFTAFDPDGDDIFLMVSWGCCGPGQDFHQYGPYKSGEEAIIKKTYSEKGTFSIQAYVKDINGAEGDIASLEVTMPKKKLFEFNFVLLEWLFELFSRLRFLVEL